MLPSVKRWCLKLSGRFRMGASQMMFVTIAHSYSSVTARYKSLQEKGLIEILLDADGEEVKRKGESGRNQRVMVLAERQLELPWNI